MPEEDFEIFLSLLGQLLRLDPKQKAAIADELRDHLEERLSELSDEGVPRKDAVRKALEEFGDAAGLASQFTTLSQKRRRKLLMRATFATTATLGLVFLAILLFGPSNPDAPPQQVVAQDQEPAKEKRAAAPKPAEPVNVMPEKLLEVGEVEFIDTPLVDAAAFLSEAHNFKVILDENALTEEGISKDLPLTLTAKAPLYLILNRMLKPDDMVWYYKNEILFITSWVAAEELLFTHYYPAKPLLDRGFTEQQTIDLIQHMTTGPWQDIDGTGGEMLFIGQMLSVRQTFHAHMEIGALLNALRKLDQPALLQLEPKEHEKLREALQSPVNVEFIETPLIDAAEFLSDMMGVPVVLDRPGLDDEGVAADAPINLTLMGKSLATTLEVMLGPLDLEAVLEDGTILITTKTEAEGKLTTMIHNVTDIADSQSALNQLLNAVMTVTSGPWLETDGTGGAIATYNPGTIVVRQEERVHQEIVKLLENLRRQEGDMKLPALPPQVVTHIYRMNADTAEDLLTTLPEFVAPGTWQGEKNKTGQGSIRKVAAGQTFVNYPGTTKAEKPSAPPQNKPGEKPSETAEAEKEPEPQYIVVPQAVLMIRHTEEVHREIDDLLQSLLPFGSYSAGTPLMDRGQMSSGGGFF